ncbi:MAG: uracil-DNA glycosylase [candidate division KSB1 bacterium]|nr:uracil-DNA glycosylase [candidate division KSB1 bacterium]
MEGDFHQILDLTSRYLRQQRELYGEEIFLSSPEKRILSRLSPGNSWELDEFYHSIQDCQKCELARRRTHLVFGSGNPRAKLMLVGEAPGQEEDVQGEPFVGPAGQLLNKILKAINFDRSEVYVANVLKCRPPDNREPLPEEIQRCGPFLLKQIDLIRPKVILALGRIAAQALLNTTQSLGELRGKVHAYKGVPVIVTYHPAALLRHPEWKRGTWEDVQMVQKIYDQTNG